MTTKHIDQVRKKEFVAAALDLKNKTFVVYVMSLGSAAFFSSNPLDVVYSFCRSQIASLITKEIFTKIPDKYAKFADVFSLDLASKLPEHTKINNHAIKLING